MTTLIVTANKDNNLCQLPNRWIDFIRFSQWQNILLSVIHAPCSCYTLQLLGRKRNLNLKIKNLKIRTCQKRVWCHPECIASCSLDSKHGHPFSGLTLLQRLQRVGAWNSLCFQSRGFCFRTHRLLHSFVCQFIYVLEVTEGVRCELALQSPYRTKLEPQKRVTENESKANNHNFMICMGAKTSSQDGLGELVKFL